MILAGDIGGTKTNLALYEFKDGILELVSSTKFVSAAYSKFSEIIDEFKEKYPNVKIKSACFGIAGPVLNGECKTTNLPWEKITVEEIREHLGTKKVAMLNDLAITAYGMLYLNDDELISLNPKAKAQKQSCCVIAAGTGLGQGILYYDGVQYHPMATEGGHTDFAPQDVLEDALLKWLRDRYPEHISYERVLCGEGIYTLYSFLKEYTHLEEPLKMLNIEDKVDKSAMISKCALEDSDLLCLKTLELFCKIYGAEAGNLALKSLSMGGVFIGGGIAPKILPLLQNGIFMKAFLNKGRFKSLLEKMEVKVSLNQETALLGAANFAKDKLI
jgi:glucokinase